jgi:hypothetical protein
MQTYIEVDECVKVEQHDDNATDSILFIFIRSVLKVSKNQKEPAAPGVERVVLHTMRDARLTMTLLHYSPLLQERGGGEVTLKEFPQQIFLHRLYVQRKNDRC